MFVVPGEPVTWKRPKQGRNRSTGAVFRYSDKGQELQKDRVRAAARNAGIRKTITGPVHLQLAFYRGHGKATDLSAGDLDNLEKLVKDALNRLAYVDDSQVVRVEKWKDVDPGNPRTEVTIWEIE